MPTPPLTLAERQVDAVLKLHARDDRGYCAYCNRLEGHSNLWPCATVLAIRVEASVTDSAPAPSPPPPRTHTLKVEPPYFDALLDGSKTFDVRKNDRAFQHGDRLHLIELHTPRSNQTQCRQCVNHSWSTHETKRTLDAVITYVYAGDPRFTGLEPHHVVLGLRIQP